MPAARLSGCAIVLVCRQVERTAAYSRDVLGFRAVEHSEQAKKFPVLYRDSVEIVLVKARHGQVLPSRERYGAGFDAYRVPDTPDEVVEAFYQEVLARGARIVQPLGLTPYGSYEFAPEDVDGHILGVGHVRDERKFFAREGSPAGQ